MNIVQEKIIKIERKLEEQTELLEGIGTVMNYKRHFMPKKEIIYIIFELHKILDEFVKLKKTIEESI